ncbi:hypothetical protein CALCODRAFT_480085 [Calocera cornea HHB12733]|uniref:Uncharacterized protein n=1 Tax=Calocera cornea HHB12733 TaxID=1353952 RepID=A0A165IY44_9BASI|nr:hypothetical protein CALCODRAFT_480085 [Calocera cornea HHB12733]
MLIGQDWIQTCLCPDDSLSGQWNFFLRNHGQYITTTELENLTCSINPYLGNATSSYESQTLQYTTVIGPDYRSSPDVSIIGALLLLLPQIVHLSQNQQGNAVADNVLDALLSQGFTLGNTLGNTSQNLDFYLMGAYESIWQNFLLGWIEYTITCLRREYSPAVNPLNDPASWRITGQLTGKPYGWDFVPLNILFLTPILLVSAVTVSLLLWALHGRRTTDLVGTHDLTDAVTLLLAGATCHENLRNRIEEAGKERGDVLEDRTVREIRVIFRAGRLARDAE